MKNYKKGERKFSFKEGKWNEVFNSFFLLGKYHYKLNCLVIFDFRIVDNSFFLRNKPSMTIGVKRICFY